MFITPPDNRPLTLCDSVAHTEAAASPELWIAFSFSHFSSVSFLKCFSLIGFVVGTLL